MTATHRISCHRGNVVATVTADIAEAMTCNCSICRRRGHVIAIVAPERVKVETPSEALTVYTFNQHNIKHKFCKTCGCAPFGEGLGPDGKPMAGINLNCAENIDLKTIKITEFDGAALPRID